MTTTLTYVNEDGFEMDGTCVPVRLTDAVIDKMWHQSSGWWLDGCPSHPGTGKEILWGKWDGKTFIHDWPKKGNAILVTTAQLLGILGEVEYLLDWHEGDDWDFNWDHNDERKAKMLQWHATKRSLKANVKRLNKLVAACHEFDDGELIRRSTNIKEGVSI